MTLTEPTINEALSLPFLDDLVTGTTRLGYEGITRTSSIGLCRMMVCMAPVPVGAPPSADGGADGVAVAEDRGSFSHGVCRVCGWRGPGRRSRRVARQDASEHLPACAGALTHPA